LKLKLKGSASMGKDTIIGVDLTKNVFEEHGVTVDGTVVFRKKPSRPQFALFATRRDWTGKPFELSRLLMITVT